jgi:hypothetical protein
MHLWARMAGKRSVTCLMTHQHPTLLIHRKHIIGIFMLRLMGHTVVMVADLVLSLKHAMERALREYLFLMLRRITMSLNIRVGVLVDHDDLAATVNGEVLAAGDPEWRPVDTCCVPPGSEHHWRGIRARIAGFGSLRAARIDGRENPAHPLANTPHEYDHVNRRKERCIIPNVPYTSDCISVQQTSPSESLHDQQRQRGQRGQRRTQTESAASTRTATDRRSYNTDSNDSDDDIPPPSRFDGCGYASD